MSNTNKPDDIVSFLMEDADLVQETATTSNDTVPNTNDGSQADLDAATAADLLKGDTVINGEEQAELSEDATMTLDDEELLATLSEAYEVVSEQMNIVRLNRQTKLLNLTNRSALILAKRAGDPLFTKYSKFNKIRRDIRAQIVKKYGAKATSYARKVMSNTQTGNAPAKAK